MIVRSKTKVRVLILLAGLAVLIGGAAGIYAIRHSHIKKYYQARRASGIEQYQKGDYASALVTLGQYIRREEANTDAEAIYAYAESRRRVEMPASRHLAQAMTSLQRVLALDYKKLDVQRELLDLYTQLGYNIEAVELANKILADHKDDLQALRAKTRGLAARQLNAEARTLCEHFNQLVPLDLEMNVLYLQVLRDLGERPRVLQVALDLLSKNPNDPAAELILSIACSFIEEITSAQREQLKTLLKAKYDTEFADFLTARYPKEVNLEVLDPLGFSRFFALQASRRDSSDLVLVRYLVEQLDRTRLVPQSLDVLQRADARQETPWLVQMLIRRLWESGRFADVLKRMEKMPITGTSPTDIEFRAIRGISQARSNLKEQAAQTAAALAGIKDDRIAQAWAMIIQELVLKTDGDARQVADSIRLAFEVQRNNPYLRFYYGLANLQRGERDAAMEAFQQVAAARPHWQFPLMQLSRLKLEAGQKQAALEDATEAVAIAENLGAASNLVIVLAANTDLSTVTPDSYLFKAVKNIQEQFPNEESTLPLYVQLLAKTNQADLAKKAITSALASKTPPGDRTFLRLAAISAESKLGLEDACWQAAEKSSGVTAEIAFARAASMSETGKSSEALKYFQDAMQKAPQGDVSWRLAWATLLEQTRDQRAAATWIALADDPAHKANLIVQRDALAATSVQTDPAFIARIIERIRAVAGEDSIGWKMAQVRLALGDRDKSPSPELIKSLNEIVAAAPSNVEARTLLARAYEKSNNYPAAIEQINAARKLQPSSRELDLSLARLFMIQQDFQRAREIIDGFPIRALEPAQRRIAARIAGQLGNIRQAIDFFEGAAADAPPLDRLYLADLYRRISLPEKAEAIYQSLLQNPDRVEVVMAAADYYATRGKTDLAMAALAHLEKLSITPAEKDYAIAAFSSRHGQSDAALTKYLAVVQNDPSKPNGWRSLITEYIRAGRTGDAVEAARKAIAAVPAESARQFNNVIDSAANLKALEPEKTLIGLMVAVMEPSPEGDAAVKSLPIIAKAIAANTTAEQVTAQLRPIADSAPRLVPLQMLLVQNYLIMGRRDRAANEEAAAIALRSQSVSPASAEIARNAAYAVFATGNFAKALPPAQKWRELTPENPITADLFIAELHLRLQDFVSVLADLKPYVAKPPSDPKELVAVIIFRGQALVMRGDDAAAAEYIGPYLSTQPMVRSAWRDLSGFLPNTLAERWIARLAAETPADQVNEQIDLAIAWHTLFAGRARFAGTNDPKHKQAASDILDRLATTAPDHPFVIQARAILAQRDNRLGAAEQGYRRALELKPDLPVSLNNLANMLFDRGDLKEALSLAQRAVAVSPQDASVRDTLGDVHLKLKNYPSALESYQAAMKLEPRNIQRPIKLAQAYIEAGQTQNLSTLLEEIDKLMAEVRVSDDQREAINKLRSKIPKTASR